MGTVNVTLGDGKKLNLILGQQLENAVTAVVFDFSAWQTEFGSGTLGLSVQRHGDTQPYAVVPTVSGTNATWNISELDTAYKGVGEVQVTYTVGSVVKKSTVYKFTVYRSLGENGEYPSPGQTWQEEIEDELTDIKQDLAEYEQIFTADVGESVANWLDEHPEATTTVMDGSITKEKLSDDLANMFIDGDYNISRFNNASNQETFVYWRHIPSNYQPAIEYSGTTDYAVKLANENGATCAINASRWDVDTDDFYGYFRVDGTTLHENDRPSTDNSRYILCYKDNTLSSHPISTPTADLNAENYEWALTGFETIIIDGQPTDRATLGNTLSTDFQPRSFIAQNYDGSYIIGCCDGRSGRTNGFRLSDIYRFLLTTGCDVKFAYSLDGGGSVTLVEKGERVNSYINNENRKIKSIIYFKKPNAYYNNFLKSKVSDIENSYRAAVNSYEYKQGDIYAYSDGSTKNIEFRSFDTLLTQAYLRFQKDRFFCGFDNDFSDSGTTYNLLDVDPDYFSWNDQSRYLPKNSNESIDYIDELPYNGATGIFNVNITSSANAVQLGLTAEDYGQSVYITFRTSVNYEVLITRANIFFRIDRGAWISSTSSTYTAGTLASGVTGDFGIARNGKTIVVKGDLYIGSSLSANAQIASQLPEPITTQNGALISASKVCALEIATNGTLKTLHAVPDGYYSISMTYIAY